MILVNSRNKAESSKANKDKDNEEGVAEAAEEEAFKKGEESVQKKIRE